MLYLVLTIITDVIGVVLLGKAKGFTHPWLLAAGILCTVIGFVAFSFATRTIPTSSANALWCGFSIVLVVLLSKLVLGDHLSIVQYACIGLILVGAIGLELSVKE